MWLITEEVWKITYKSFRPFESHLLNILERDPPLFSYLRQA